VTKQHPIPDAVLEQHLAILGKTGRGKTNTAKVCVEQVYEQDSRVCILDTIKSDWWGLTSSADGRRAGLPFHILGGPHAHFPLSSNSGKAIAELVARGDLKHTIIDMAEFEPGGQMRFFVDFAPKLLQRMKGVLYLVLEEAHLLAPKERAGMGHENMSVHWAKMLATAGRTKGIRLLVLSQRTQAVHNAVLGSCDSMIVHGMTAPADMEPVIKWLKANSKDKELNAKIEDSLSGLKRGTGWLCSSEAKLFELREFPKARTYDNTATPTDDEELQEVKTAPIDVEQLRAILGKAAAEAEAEDPKMLRKRIADLEQQLHVSGGAVPKQEVARLRAEAFDEARKQFEQTRTADIKRACDVLRATADEIHGRAAQLEREAPILPVPHVCIGEKYCPSPMKPEAITTLRNKALYESVPIANGSAPSNGHATEEPPSVRKILDVIHRSYPVSLSFDAAARRAGISSASSAYRKYRVLVHGSREIEHVDGKYRSRPEFAGSAPMTSESSLALWIQKLPPSYGKMLEAIHQHGPVDKERIADLAGVSATSSGLGTGLRELQRLQLISHNDGHYDIEEGLR
jgi:hypothetical protein